MGISMKRPIVVDVAVHAAEDETGGEDGPVVLARIDEVVDVEDRPLLCRHWHRDHDDRKGSEKVPRPHHRT